MEHKFKTGDIVYFRGPFGIIKTVIRYATEVEDLFGDKFNVEYKVNVKDFDNHYITKPESTLFGTLDELIQNLKDNIRDLTEIED